LEKIKQCNWLLKWNKGRHWKTGNK
jgi:hypothetical protein